jgi:hypothetical protein
LLAPPAGGESPAGNKLPDAVRQEVAQALARMQTSLDGDDPVETTLELLMPDDVLTKMKSDPEQWKRIQASFESRKKAELIAALEEIDLSKAVYDAATSEVTFPVGRRPLVFVKANGRWAIKN